MFQFVPLRDSYIPPFFLFFHQLFIQPIIRKFTLQCFLPQGPWQVWELPCCWWAVGGCDEWIPRRPCGPLLRTPDHCHWRELPQYHFCRDKHVFCRDKSMLAMTKLLSRQNYVGPATNIILSRQKLLSRQAWQNFCCDKIMFVATNVLSQQKYGCRYKTFVATKMILVAAPANDRSPPRLNWTIHPMQPCKHCQESRLCFWKNRKEYRV